jgi:uncharacterized protein (DUF1501 family)
MAPQMELHRRDVLKGLAALGIGSSLPLGFRHMAFAAEAGSPVLVVMHLRGGCDGLNLVSPASDPDFIDARASELRVLTDGKDAGYALANGPAPNIDFRLHNVAGGLNELYKGGSLAFIHACGLTDANRSHFAATDMIEAGVATQADLARSDNGWLARATAARNAQALQAVSVSGAVSGDLRGQDLSLAAPDINNGIGPVGGSAVAAALWQMYGGRKDAIGEAGQLALQLPVTIDQRVARDPSGKPVPYAPDGGANYDKAGGIGNNLKTVARLIKMDIGLQAITLDYGNWDTHEYQAGRFRGQVEPMSNGLAAFWNDLSQWHDRVTLVTVTEFGRRLRSNKSGGTDHGRAGVAMALGGKVRGGKIYGRWPGMGSAQLEEGVDLAVTTDYRQILTEALAHQPGNRGDTVFPGFKPGTPLGLFG